MLLVIVALSRPELQQRVMSGSVSLWQQGTELKFVAPNTIKIHEDAWHLYATWDNVGGKESWCCQCYHELEDLSCSMSHGDITVLSCCWQPCLDLFSCWGCCLCWHLWPVLWQKAIWSIKSRIRLILPCLLLALGKGTLLLLDSISRELTWNHIGEMAPVLRRAGHNIHHRHGRAGTDSLCTDKLLRVIKPNQI